MIHTNLIYTGLLFLKLLKQTKNIFNLHYFSISKMMFCTMHKMVLNANIFFIWVLTLL